MFLQNLYRKTILLSHGYQVNVFTTSQEHKQREQKGTEENILFVECPWTSSTERIEVWVLDKLSAVFTSLIKIMRPLLFCERTGDEDMTFRTRKVYVPIISWKKGYLSLFTSHPVRRKEVWWSSSPGACNQSTPSCKRRGSGWGYCNLSYQQEP